MQIGGRNFVRFLLCFNISIEEYEVIFGKLNTFRPEVSNGFLGDPPSRSNAEFTAQASSPWGPFEAEKDGLEVHRSESEVGFQSRNAISSSSLETGLFSKVTFNCELIVLLRLNVFISAKSKQLAPNT